MWKIKTDNHTQIEHTWPPKHIKFQKTNYVNTAVTYIAHSNNAQLAGWEMDKTVDNSKQTMWLNNNQKTCYAISDIRPQASIHVSPHETEQV